MSENFPASPGASQDPVRLDYGLSGQRNAADRSIDEVFEPLTPENDPEHERNFLLAVWFQCFLRIGWIFKTESIIMPAVLDVVGGSGWLRGCLPMLNRLGQSIPPLLASDWVRDSAIKKWILVGTTTTMGACFLLLSLVWIVTKPETNPWIPLIFLVIYGIFFASTGINQLVLNTLTGKLIRTTKRGRLALVGTVWGSILAVICAAVLLGWWLPDDPDSEVGARFDLVFAFTGLMFLAAALVAATLRERPDKVELKPHRSGWQLWKASWETLREDRNFLLLAVIAGLFGMSLTLFPHYQRLGRDRFDLGLTALIPWVIAQNIGAALVSIPAGWAADRFGTRVVLQSIVLALCMAPITALWLANEPDAGPGWFTVVFGLLGLTPVTMRIFNYYTLEIVDREDHPRYLSTLSIAMALPPILFSSLFGAMLDSISFEFVFVLVTVCVLIGWVLSFFLQEPRNVERTR